MTDMATRQPVLLAMSGGVDSSVAAYLLQQDGYDVRGVHFQLMLAAPGGQDEHGASQHARDAQAVAQRLGISLSVVDLSARLEPIIEDFVRQYARGRTPNPCIRCNAEVKFAKLIELADQEGIRWIATGHYARAAAGPDGPAIFRARCRAKDQSYFLCALEPAVLGRLLLPLGEVADKAGTRRLAQEQDLTVHDKPDSQEICFAGQAGYVELLRRRAPEALQPGDVVDASGKVLGRHGGIGRFTIGQRRGLRVAAGAPMYVTAIDPSTAKVTIGPRREVMSDGLVATAARWQGRVGREFRAQVQVRHNHAGAAAVVRLLDDNTFEAAFDEPVLAVTAGQVAGVYDGQRLLGGGWIHRGWRGGGV